MPLLRGYRHDASSETVVEAAEGLRDDPRIVLLIAAGGPDRGRIEKMLHSRQLDKVILLDQQPEEAKVAPV